MTVNGNQQASSEKAASGWGGTIDYMASCFSADTLSSVARGVNSVSTMLTGYGYEAYTEPEEGTPTVYSEWKRNKERFQELTNSPAITKNIRKLAEETTTSYARNPLLSVMADEYRDDLKATVINQVRVALATEERPESSALINEAIDRAMEAFGPGIKKTPIRTLVQEKVFTLGANILEHDANRLADLIDGVFTSTPAILHLATWDQGGSDLFEITPDVRNFIWNRLVDEEAANSSSAWSYLSYVVPAAEHISTVSAFLSQPTGAQMDAKIRTFLANPQNRQLIVNEVFIKPKIQKLMETALPNGSTDISIPHGFFRTIGYQLTEPTMKWVQECAYAYAVDVAPALITEKVFASVNDAIQVGAMSPTVTLVTDNVNAQAGRVANATGNDKLAPFIEKQVRKLIKEQLKTVDAHLTKKGGTKLRNKLKLPAHSPLRRHLKAIMNVLSDAGVDARSRIDIEGFVTAMTLNIVANVYQYDHTRLTQLLQDQVSPATLDQLVAIAIRDQAYFTTVTEESFPVEVYDHVKTAGYSTDVHGVWKFIHEKTGGRQQIMALLTADLCDSIAEELLLAALPNEATSLDIPKDLLASYGITLTDAGKQQLEAKAYNLLKSALPGILGNAVTPTLVATMKLPEAVHPFGTSYEELGTLVERSGAAPQPGSTDNAIRSLANETDRLMGSRHTSEYMELASAFSVHATKEVIRDIAADSGQAAKEAHAATSSTIDTVIDSVKLDKLIHLNLLNITKNLGEKIEGLDTYFLESLAINVMEDLAAYTEALARISETQGLDLTREQLYEALRADQEYQGNHERLKRIGDALQSVRLTRKELRLPPEKQKALREEKLQQQLVAHFCKQNAAELMELLLPSADDLLIPEELCAQLGFKVTEAGKEKIYQEIKDKYLPDALAVTILKISEPYTAKNTVYSSAEAMRGRNELIEMKEDGKSDAEIRKRAKVLIKRATTKAQSAINEYKVRVEKQKGNRVGRHARRLGLSTPEAAEFTIELMRLQNRITETVKRIEGAAAIDGEDLGENGSSEFDQLHGLFLEVMNFEGRVRADIAERRWNDMDEEMKTRAKQAGVRLLDSVTTLFTSANDVESLPTWLRWILVPLVGLARRFGYMNSAGEMVGETTIKALSQRSLREWISFGLESGAEPLHKGEWDELDRFLPTDAEEGNKYPHLHVPEEEVAEYRAMIENGAADRIVIAVDEMVPTAPSARIRQAYLASREARNYQIRRFVGEKTYWMKRTFDACFDHGISTSFGWVRRIKEAAKTVFYRKPLERVAARTTWLVGLLMNEHLICVAFDRVSEDLGADRVREIR